MSATASPNLPPGTALIPGAAVNPVRAALIFLAAVTVFRLWYCTLVELVPDEAYYWLWSKHLAASYRDKGPGIAWVIALGTWLFGDTVFGVRFLGVLLSGGTGWQLLRLARRLYDGPTALWCVVVAVVMPLFSVGSILMTIDSLSVFCWAWALNAFWTALDTGRTRHWAMLGLVVGLGFLAKFTNGVQLACFALFLVWSAPHRRFLLSRQMLAMLAAFGLCVLPILYWNLQVGWVHAQALHSRSGVEGSFGVHPKELLRFLGEELGVVSPLLMIGMVVAAAGLWWKRSAETRVRFLLSQFVPLYGLFVFFSLNRAGKGNWPAPALVAGMVLLVAFWGDLVARRPGWRWVVGTALWIALGMTAFLHLTLVLPPLPGSSTRVPPAPGEVNLAERLQRGRDRLMRRAQGWASFAGHVQRAREETGIPLLIGNHYSQASMMQFYLPDHPRTYLPKEPYGSSQFTLWPGYELQPGTRALYVTDSTNALPAKIRDDFGESRMLDEFWSVHRGRAMTHFRIYELTHR
jgi:4-amino-4-deoxy-L-arabinose transferase-like glycosyltransferase